MDQFSRRLEDVINSEDGDLVTANLCDITGGNVTAVASSWRSGVVAIARGAELSIHDSNALEDAARVAFNDSGSAGGGCAHMQSPAARLTWATVSARDSVPALATVQLPSSCTALALDQELGCLAVGCADGQVLVVRHVTHVIRNGDAALAPINGEGANPGSESEMLLAWAGGVLLHTPGGRSSSSCGFFDWDGYLLARLDAEPGQVAVTAVAGSPLSSPTRALFAIGRADGSAEVACYTTSNDGGSTSTGGSVEIVATGELNLPGESGSGSVEALTWVSSTGLAAVRREGVGNNAVLQLIPVGFTNSSSPGSSGGGGSLSVGGDDGFDPEGCPTWHLLGDVAPPSEGNGGSQGVQRVSLATVGPLVVCAPGLSAPNTPCASAYKVADGIENDDDDDAPRLRECGEWLELPPSLGEGGAVSVAFGLQSSVALDAREPFRLGEGEPTASVSVFCALRDGTLAVGGVLCAGSLDPGQGTCAPFQPEVPTLPGTRK